MTISTQHTYEGLNTALLHAMEDGNTELAHHIRAAINKMGNAAVDEVATHELTEAEGDETLGLDCPGHESTEGPAGVATYCDGSCQPTPPAKARWGIPVQIVEGKYGNRTPNGITELTLVGEGMPPIFEATDARPAVEIRRHRAGPQYPAIAILVDGNESPAAFHARGTAGADWSMASGSWIHSSDSRFPFRRPVALHNRYETGE